MSQIPLRSSVGVALGALVLALAVVMTPGCGAGNEDVDASRVIQNSGGTDWWPGYLANGRSQSEPNNMTGGYTRTANYTLFRADEGKVEVEPIEQAICKGIESLADYVHEDPAVRAIKYLSGRSAGVVTWSVTPKKDGKEVEVRIDIEEKPLPRTRW